MDKHKKDEHNMFTTNNCVSIQTLLVHNQKVCVNQDTTYWSPGGMFPLGIETIWGCTFSIPFQTIF